MLDPNDITLTSTPEEQITAMKNVIVKLSTENFMLKSIIAGHPELFAAPAAEPASKTAKLTRLRLSQSSCSRPRMALAASAASMGAMPRRCPASSSRPCAIRSPTAPRRPPHHRTRPCS